VADTPFMKDPAGARVGGAGIARLAPGSLSGACSDEEYALLECRGDCPASPGACPDSHPLPVTTGGGIGCQCCKPEPVCLPYSKIAEDIAPLACRYAAAGASCQAAAQRAFNDVRRQFEGHHAGLAIDPTVEQGLVRYVAGHCETALAEGRGCAPAARQRVWAWAAPALVIAVGVWWLTRPSS